MRIAFLYIAEAYQCYHGAAVALELERRHGWSVTSYYNDDETPYHLDRIHRAYGVPPADHRRLRRSPLTAALQRIRRLGMFKTPVMFDNRAELNGYDAIVSLEDTATVLPRLGVTHPKLIFCKHGSGDRARGFDARIAAFDLILIAGARTAERMLAAGILRPDQYALTGTVKLETAARIAQEAPPLFPNAAPVVLYNPHKAPGLSSWDRFIEPMLDGFGAQPDMNLIVAPHVKMFRRQSEGVRDRWRSRSTANILVDPGSDRSIDTSYAEAADIYVGDVSSLVYEFLARPRPCVFLNAQEIAWRDDPSFANWHLGDVVDDPADLMEAIRAAPARHALYRDRQAEMARTALGDASPGAAVRAADAVARLLER